MLIQVEQGSREWFEARKGRLTASVAASAAGMTGIILVPCRLLENVYG